MNRKKKTKFKSEKFIGFLTFLSLIAIFWEFMIFRKTLISIYIPLMLFIGGGFILFLILKNKIKYYVESSYSNSLIAFHGVIMFGGLLMFLFMAANFYLSTGENEVHELKVINSGELNSRRSDCDPQTATVEYYGFEKQLVFGCHTDLSNTKSIKVKMQKGLFGFFVVKDVKLVNVVP